MLRIWLKRLTFLVVILNGMLFFVHVFTISRTLSDGAHLNPAGSESPWSESGARITVTDNHQNDLRDGDIIVAIEGHALSAWLERVLCFSGGCSDLMPPEIREGAELTYVVQRGEEQEQITATLRPYPFWEVLKRSWGGLAFAVVNYVIFSTLLIKKPDDAAVIGLALGSSGLFGSMGWLFGYQMTDLFVGHTFWLYRFATELIYLLSVVGVLHFALVFPQPLPFIRDRQWMVAALYPLAYMFYVILLWGGNDNPLVGMSQFNNASTAVEMIYYIMAFIGIIVNYRNLQQERAREQIRIVVFTVGLVLALSMTFRVLPSIIFGESIFNSNTMGLVGLIVPLAIVFAIQRHNLWNIDPIINRTLVYISLTAIIIGLYMIIVVMTGGVLQTGLSVPSSILATGIVAVMFHPLRFRSQQIIDRIMYGKRDDPAAVLSSLAHHLETTDQPVDVLPNLVQTIASALKIPYVAITINKSVEVIAAYGTLPEQREMISLVYQNNTIGHLVVAPRGINEQFTAGERALLTTIAALTAATVHAVQLSDELLQSRQRIVTAREEERRRIRRDLHDGLGPQLASQTLALEAIAQLIPTNPQKALSLLESLQGQAHEAILDVRRLVYDLRPPALDDLGLVGALKQSAARYETGHLHFSFDIPEMRTDLPAAVETAAFRIAQEAMTNVVRHADATHCILRLYCDDNEFDY